MQTFITKGKTELCNKKRERGRESLKEKNMAKVELCISCSEGLERTFNRGLEQDLVKSGGTGEIPLFTGKSVFTFHGLVLQKTAQNALCGQLKLTNHIRLKSSSIKLSWITPCDSPLRIDKSTAGKGRKKKITASWQLHDMTWEKKERKNVKQMVFWW